MGSPFGERGSERGVIARHTSPSRPKTGQQRVQTPSAQSIHHFVSLSVSRCLRGMYVVETACQQQQVLTCELHVAPGLWPAGVSLCLPPDVLNLQQQAPKAQHTTPGQTTSQAAS